MRPNTLLKRLTILTLFFLGVLVMNMSSSNNVLKELLVYSAHGTTFQNNEQLHRHQVAPATEILPSWRVLTDCSSFRDGCAARRIANGRTQYEEYPFTFDDDFDDNYEWINLSDWPKEWDKKLAPKEISGNTNNKTNVTAKYEDNNDMAGYVYPPMADDEKIESCLKSAESLPYLKQLENILNSIKREPILNDMVAFTVTDIKYAREMIHDVMEMNDNIVGFDGAFFMVGLDKETVELGCKHGYPIIAGPGVCGDDKGLEDKVRNTKFQISYDLLMLNQTFFFYEMDVWFVKSPKQLIFKNQIRTKDNNDKRVDMLVSSHQNNPMAMNIGIYSVLPNKATQEYFKLCLQVSSKVKMHDQVIMQRLAGWMDQIRYLDGKKKRNEKLYSLVETERTNERSNVPNDFPNITASNLIQSKFYGGHAFAASQWPVPTIDTIAVHTLCGLPLMEPHGKIMTAKELGVYHGFSNTVAGYYHRTGQYRRYIWLDGRQTGYSFVETWFHHQVGWGRYHNWVSFGLTMATLIALAQHTGRILILPRFIHDNGETYVWEFIDLKPVEDMGVQIRETNFMTNPKAWYSDTIPFKSVARIALGGNDPDIESDKMFAQYETAASSSLGGNKQTQQLAWRILQNKTKAKDDKKDEMNPTDLFFAMSKSIPEIDNAEALLVNPTFIQNEYHGRIFSKTHGSKVVTRIRDIYEKLRWCKHAMEYSPGRHGTPLVTPDDDCYGRGQKM